MHLDFYDDLLYLDSTFFDLGSHDSVRGWSLYYEPESAAEAVQRGDGSQTSHQTVEEFLREIATDEPSDLRLAGRWNQRSYEWQPADVAFQLLVSCARSSNFSYYLAQSLKRLGKEVRI